MPRKPAHEELEQKIRNLVPGDHLCCIYEGKEEHQATLTPFLRQGLERGEKVFYIVDASTRGEVLSYLRQDGLEVEPYLESGQLAILTADQAYLREGVFDPDRMISLLREETRHALEDGYSALRVTGEMSWALKGLDGFERLIEYEAKLNDFFLGSECMAICQYDRRIFRPEILLDVLTTHPIAVIGTEVFENFYYMPPEDFLGPDPAGAKLENWLKSLAKRKEAEAQIIRAKQEWERTFDAVPDLIMILDNEYRIVRVNKAMADRLGCTPKDLVHKICYNVLHGAEKPTSNCPHVRLMTDGLPHGAEVHEDRLGGDFLVSVNPLHDPDGKLVGSVHVAWDITERKQVEEKLRDKTHALNERVKKLNCLYGISHLLEKQGISIEEIFKGTVNLIPPSWQYPEVTCVRINVEGREFTTENFQETRWKQKSDIIVHGHQIGSLEIYYLSEKPESDEGPFLKEERSLIDAIAERLGRIIERVQAQEALRKAHDELERRVEERTVELKHEIKDRKQAEEALRESENQLRHLSSQLLSAQEDERKSVAQDLHDSIGQMLTAIKFGTEKALGQLPKRALKKIRQPLEATIAMVQNGIEEVRRIQMALRPPTLDDLGILATISWFCREFQTIYSGIRIEQHLDIQEDEVPDPLKTIIYRVMQEALNNIAKHSGADLVRLSLRRADGAIELAIEDNGLGFDLEGVLSVESSKRGIGVSSMKERIKLSDGSFIIESAAGAGTIIRASWPDHPPI